MNSYYVIWGAIVILAGAIVLGAGVLAGAITNDAGHGTGISVFGSILMLIGFLGPGVGGIVKRAYDSAPVSEQPKGDS